MKRKKEYKQQSIVSGKSVKDIMAMTQKDLNSLSVSDMRKVVGRLVSAGNKRIRNLEQKTDMSSPAYLDIQNSGGKFSTRGKNAEQLKAEFVRAVTFMSQETSSATKWNNIQTGVISKIKGKVGDFALTQNQWTDFWKAYKDLTELDKSARLNNVKYEIFKMISEAVEDKSKSPDQIALEIAPEVSKIYERNQQTKEQFSNGGVSKYFSYK